MTINNVSKIIESSYFHWGNGGLSLTMRETEEIHSEDEKLCAGLTFSEYDLDIGFRHHGACFQFTLPLGSMEIVGWLHETTGRLLKRMAGKHQHARNNAFIGYDGELIVEDEKSTTEHFRWVDGALAKEPPPVMKQTGQTV